MKVKDTLLSMPFGTACHRLRKAIIFSLAGKLGLTVCHRCGGPIGSVEDFSIEHKDGWQGAADPVQAFFDLDNIAFSHLGCNISAAAKPNKRFASLKEKRVAYRSRHAELKRFSYNPTTRREKYMRTGW